MFGDMYGDFSRLTFSPEKHFSAVLLQQGRVMLDADVNELTAVLLRMQRLVLVDLIGPYAGPAREAGFAIDYDNGNPPRLAIGSGRYYVQGLLCELDATTAYHEQPCVALDPPPTERVLPDAPFLVYLRVWERQITAIQDPSLTEPALGGPDTAVRSKVVWEVIATTKFPPGSNDLISDWPAVDADCARTRWESWERARATKPMPVLRARAQGSVPDLDPATASSTDGYGGFENHLYRVEVHDGGTPGEGGAASFKWSRDDGAAMFPTASRSGCELTLASLVSNGTLELAAGDWVEVLDDQTVLCGDRHPLLRVSRIEPTKQLVVLEGHPPEHVASRPDLHPFLRRWDQRETASGDTHASFVDGVLAITETTIGEDGWLELEHGVQIQFQRGGEYTAGDYWLIPARAASQDVEWPNSDLQPAALPPRGISYGYAPLSIVDASGTSHDLRSTFAPISRRQSR